MSTTAGSLTIELHGAFNVCSTQDLMMFNVTVRPQSSCGEATGDVPLACYSGVTPGSTVMYYNCCSNDTIRSHSGQFNRTCHTNGNWSEQGCDCNSELSPQLHYSNYMIHWLAKIHWLLDL